MNAHRPLLLAAAGCLLLVAGCHVSSHKNTKGDNVDIGTPFGSMHVKTNDNAQVAGIGITPYPGAVPVKQHDGKENDAADINMNFGGFHLGVKAATFQTPDAPSKVEAFYRKDLARYGDVLKCQGDHAMGQPTHTSQGLTCSDKEGKREFHVRTEDKGDHAELRAGSPEHMHIVGIEPKDGGTKIGLVTLDLPGHHDSNESE